MPADEVPTAKKPDRNKRGLLGLNAAEKEEVAERLKAERKAKIAQLESVKPVPVEIRPMRAWSESARHYTGHRR